MDADFFPGVDKLFGKVGDNINNDNSSSSAPRRT
jgi:hypothetical protein